MYHLPAPVRRGLYFGLQRAVGSRIAEAWREFQRWEGFSPARLEENVDVKLSRVLTRATAESGYYRKLGLVRNSGETVKDFLQRFPVLTREQLREHFTDIVVDRLRGEILSPASKSSRRYDWLVVKTGGTTGHPTTVVHDAQARDWGRATRLASAKYCGHPLGTRYFRLWGSEPDLLKEEATLHLRIQRNLLGEIPLNAFRAKEHELRHHWETLRAHPEIHSMMAYVDAAVSLALFIEDQQLDRPKLKAIMACAGTVMPEWRDILQRAFSAEVFDKYGSRECCDIACECREHSGLHVYSPNVFVEIVDEQGNRCEPGKTGRILVTMLNNPSFPMIRYQIGDMGQWAEPSGCPCGLPYPRLKDLQGRQDDMLVTQDDTLLTSVFVRHFIGFSLIRQLIREWQLEQTGAGQFIFRYIPTDRANLDANLKKIRESFKLAFGQDAHIQLCEVASIQPGATGKIRWIINSWKR